MRKWIDENTGREIRQLTDLPERCIVGYYRFRKHLPGGLIMAFGKHAEGNVVAIDPESGDYFLGKTLGEADDAAFAKYPDKLLCFVRIGSQAVMPLKTW